MTICKKIQLWPFLLFETILLGLAGACASDIPPVARALLLMSFAWVPFLIALFLLHRQDPGPRSLVLLLGGALMIRLALFFPPLSLSDDAYRYLWDGRVTLAGVNPYRHAPSSADLTFLRDASWSKINHPDVRTVYPPLAQAGFALLTWVWPSVHVFRVSAALLDLLLVFLILGAANGSFGPPWKKEALVAAASYGWCPLPAVETALAGHIEPLAALLLLLALLAARQGKRSAGAWLALSTAVKILPLLALPLAARRIRSMWLSAPLLLALLYLPFLSAGWEVLGGLDAMARRWRGNEGVFHLLDKAAGVAVTAVDAEARRTGIIHFPRLDKPLSSLRGTFLDPHKSWSKDSTLPAGAFPVADLAEGAAKAAAFALIVVLIFLLLRSRTEPLKAAALIMAATVMLLPVIHPWYLLLFAPLWAACGMRSWLWLALTLPWSYLALDGWVGRGEWILPAWVQPMEFIPFFIAFAAEQYLESRTDDAQGVS